MTDDNITIVNQTSGSMHLVGVETLADGSKVMRFGEQTATPVAGRTGTLTVELECDSAELQAMLKEIVALCEQSPAWLRWLCKRTAEQIEYSVDLVRVDAEGLRATLADKIRVVAKPTDQLIRLLAAMRAGNGQGSGGIDFEVEHE